MSDSIDVSTTGAAPIEAGSFDVIPNLDTVTVTFKPLVSGDFIIGYIGGEKTVTIAPGDTSVSSTIVSIGYYYDGAVTLSFGDSRLDTKTVRTAPEPPTISKGSTTETSIEVTWTREDGAEQYRLYRGDALITTTSDTSYTETALTPGTYTYHVTSLNSDSQESGPSNTLDISTELQPPIIVQGEIFSTNIEITWGVVDGASSYTVYRDGLNRGTTADTSFLDYGLTPDTEYTFRVIARNSVGQTADSAFFKVSTTSAPASFSAATPTYTGSQTAILATTIIIEKNASRDDQIDISFVPLKAGTYFIDYDNPRIATVTVSVSGSETDARKSVPTITIGYGFDENVIISFRERVSDIVEVARAHVTTGPAPPPPATPALGIASNTHNTIELAWGAVENAETYTLTRIVDGGANVVVESGDILSATDRNLTPSTNYKYVIVATNAAGTSTPSAEFAASTTAAPVETPAIKADSFVITNPAAADTLLVKFTALKEGTFTITSSESSDTVVVSAEDVSDSVEKEETITVGFEFDGDVTLSFDSKDVASQSARTLAIKAGTFIATARDDGDVTVSFVPLRAGTFVIQAVGAPSVDWLIITNEVGSLTPFIALLTGHGFIGDVVISFGGHEYARESISTVPGTPALTAAIPTHNSVVLSWDAQTSATGYTLSRTGGTGPTEIPVAGTGISYTDDTLEPETTYTYSIRAVSIAGDSAASNVVSVTTLAAPTPPAAPTEPFVTVTRPDTDTITVTWGNIPGTDYNIYAINEGEDPELIDDLVTSPHDITKDDSFFNKANSAEEIGVFGFSEGNPVGGAVDNNNITSEEVPPVDTTPPPVPTITTPSATVNTSSITIDGTAEAGTTITLFNGATPAGTTTADGTGAFSFAAVALSEGPNSFTVRASDGPNISTASLPVVITLDTPVAPATPALVVDSTTDTTISLSWVAVDNADSYTLSRTLGNNPAETVLSETTELAATDTGLTADTEYKYTIIATNSVGPSASSNEVTATTAATPTVDAVRNADNSVTVSWSNIETNISNEYVITISDGSSDSDTFTPTVVSNEFHITDTNIIDLNDANEVCVKGVGVDNKICEPVPEAFDTTAPSITVNEESFSIELGETYTAFTFAATDNTDGDITSGVVVVDTVDPNVANTYTVTFDVDDAAGNSAVTVTRTVTVTAQNPDDNDSGAGDIASIPSDTPKKKGGDSNEWKTKPTFGKHWNNQAVQLVDDGFVFNGMPLTITNNWHTDFDLTSSIIGDDNTVHIKGYATNGLKSVSLSLGVPEIGLKTNAESHIIVNVNSNYTSPAGYDIADIVHEQKEGLVNEKMTGASIDKVKCISSDTAERCFDVTISFVIMAPLSHEVLAINAVDKQRYSTTTYINEGVEFTGEALLAAATHELKQKHGNQNPFETISLTQQDRRYQVWEDQYGYIWSQNDYGTWLQITRPDMQQRDDLPTSVMTRIHSNFANLVIDEQDRATLIFDSKAIQGTLDESFSYDMPLRLDRVSDPALLESLSIQEMLAQEMLCDCMIYDDSDLSWND